MNLKKILSTPGVLIGISILCVGLYPVYDRMATGVPMPPRVIAIVVICLLMGTVGLYRCYVDYKKEAKEQEKKEKEGKKGKKGK